MKIQLKDFTTKEFYGVILKTTMVLKLPIQILDTTFQKMKITRHTLTRKKVKVNLHQGLRLYQENKLKLIGKKILNL